MAEYIADYAEYLNEAEFEIVHGENEGKYVKATTDLKSDYVFLKEVPLVAWPLPETEASFCEACFKVLEEGQFCCDQCSQTKSLSFLLPSLSSLRKWQRRVCSLSPVTAEALARCVCKVAADSVTLLEAGADPTSAVLSAVRPFQRYVSPPAGIPIDVAGASMEELINEVCSALKAPLEASLPESIVEALLDPEFLESIFGALVLNSQTLQTEGTSNETAGVTKRFAGIFVLQSCMNHNCEPNVEVVSHLDSAIVLKTTRPVKKGEELSLSYLASNAPLHQRQKKFANWFFKCRCNKCEREAKYSSNRAVVERDLPVDAKGLTAETPDDAVDIVLSEGVSILENVLPADELKGCYSNAEALLQDSESSVQKTRRDGGRWDILLFKDGVPLASDCKLTHRLFAMQSALLPTVSSLLDGDVRLMFCGLVTAEPSKEDQYWHPDGDHLFPGTMMSHAPFCLNVFVPLLDVDLEAGPTEFQLRSHKEGEVEEVRKIRTPTKLGSAVIFDYRIQHRGRANEGTKNRHVAYFTYARTWYRDPRNHTAVIPISTPSKKRKVEAVGAPDGAQGSSE